MTEQELTEMASEFGLGLSRSRDDGTYMLIDRDTGVWQVWGPETGHGLELWEVEAYLLHLEDTEDEMLGKMARERAGEEGIPLDETPLADT